MKTFNIDNKNHAGMFRIEAHEYRLEDGYFNFYNYDNAPSLIHSCNCDEVTRVYLLEDEPRINNES